MGVPTSEVGYTIATTRRETTEKKTFLQPAPPGTTSPLSPLTHHRDNVTAPHGRPNLRSRLHSCHAQEGGPRTPQRTCGGVGGGELFYNSVWQISHYKKNWARYDKKMHIGLHVLYRYYCQNLTKLKFSKQIFWNSLNTKLKEKPPRKQPTWCNKFLFFYLFKSSVHVSGYKFVHLQAHFLTVYTAFGTMRRNCCRPVTRRSYVVPMVCES